MREVVVLGVGMTKFGKFPDTGIRELGRQAAWDALQDAGVSPRDIQAGYFANAVLGVITGQTMCAGQLVFREVGITGIPILNIENACASGSTALREGWLAVAAGIYDLVLVVGAEKLYAKDTAKTTDALAGANDAEVEAAVGMTFPATWALRACRYMATYGAKREAIAEVAVKNHRHGALNPRAQYRQIVTLEEVLNARLVADPLTVLDCSPIGDGAAAAVLGARELAPRYTTRFLRLAASVLTTGTYDPLRDITFNDLEHRAARQAYAAAGCGPEDIDLAEVHDCFTIAELLRIESLGLCPRGEGAAWTKQGETTLGGRLPVNPSGGLLSKGHPVGATGVAQIAELTWQLRGEAGDRQVPSARVGLAHCSGGGIAGDTAACTVHILMA